uniref:hypothetical protein n=1 Tax=Altererythrobacter segetis TaxID=1104773 RepID=UPI001407CFBA|nr:hypothetical protein [Altererythrobacter segetis]
MNPEHRLPASKCRRDGWTLERRGTFLDFLATGVTASSACKRVGLSRVAAYNLRRRDPAFARAWDEALRSARKTAEDAWLAMLPEPLLRTMSALSGECKLHGAAAAAQHPVSVVRPV